MAAALDPAGALRRRRLLGGLERGTRFWLYREAVGAFVARLCDGRSHAVGETPRAAIWDYGPRCFAIARFEVVCANDIAASSDNIR
ncbi:hypothetical protein CBM2626_U20052 [Cupriavidus taiwanensis]|uniref:Uncharacterized protein n=1 Tax=Cupriavidus taiwanensis TaxID=164546 RepID=A0A375HAB2_9BURK|nr:hypothetical protein CBM2614_U10120 [Cupriavidus taiwanensis]SOZ73437.1 hypothetical protein CBM2615_U10114 [Cupriavidus taiwanensis]SOZ75100.1 hypothetical protein CBM2613_U10002 [Cupriavidus taiwanensis]SPA03836.1 hypothetical protein CBM2626_U20052 [Cupriavidus taiwanensis]SPA11698.1 protein of unknown function [Cupriavidus taiwanensis]